jgi:hypothetical protein
VVKVKVKVKLSLCLTKHHAMKMYWGVEVQLHGFLTLVLDGGEWSASHPGRFTPRERAPGTHWIGGWVGTRAILDVVVKKKIPSSHWESNPRTPIVQHTVSKIPALYLGGPKFKPKPILSMVVFLRTGRQILGCSPKTGNFHFLPHIT